MLNLIASFLCFFCGVTLFCLGVYGILGVPKSNLTVLTVLLEPSGFSRAVDIAYLTILAVLGFWLTLRLFVRIPAAITLGLILGKMILVEQTRTIGVSLSLALTLITFAVLLRLITTLRRGINDGTSADIW